MRDGEKILSECSLSHSGPSDAGWRIKWLRSDTGERMASLTEDIRGFAKRILTLDAVYPDSDGVYVCAVTSRGQTLLDSCTVQIRVESKFFFNTPIVRHLVMENI